jgi:predicted small metal-binding protein
MPFERGHWASVFLTSPRVIADIGSNLPRFEMLSVKKFDATDYNRMAKELEEMADLIHLHPEKNHNTTERLKTLAAEMRQDAASDYLKARDAVPTGNSKL